jgi:hypothetical protein
MVDIASVIGKAGAGEVEVTAIDYEEYKRSTIEEGAPTPEKYLRFLIRNGSIDHSERGLGNHNELVNPGKGYGSGRVWKSMPGD